MMLLIAFLRKQGNVPVQRRPRRSLGWYQFLGYEALLSQGLRILPCSLLIFSLFPFVSEWKLRVPVISAAYLQVMSGLARIVRGWTR